MKTIAQKIEWDFEADGDFEIRDKDDNLIYYECSDGVWVMYEYDSEGNEIYIENSNGEIIDNRPINTTDTNIN